MAIDHELTEKEIDKLCHYMQVVEVLNKHKDDFDKNSEIEEIFDKYSQILKEHMFLLSDEQRDKVLENHKMRIEKIAEEVKKRQQK